MTNRSAILLLADPTVEGGIITYLSFQTRSGLLNSDNLKVAIAQPCNELQVCNLCIFYFIADPKVGEQDMERIYY